MKSIADAPEQVTKTETEILLSFAKTALAQTQTGDLAEFGCYRGDTSLLLQKLLQNSATRRLWLYDSFAGLPEKSPEDRSAAGDAFKQGELNVTKREVIEKFKRHNLRLPIIKKAFFEDLQPTDLPEKIAFAFLDGDLYASIKISLKLTIPRLAENGIIIVHDYNNPELPGSAKAVDEFLSTHRNLKLEVRETLAIIRQN
ncbi:class I SAM-dependent methyltransferase [Candidatus Saccharibacteria bacterium]|nr:class I SAM-dependent methyltransferase [Candidatus Saccharibacteria bacterium]